MVTETVNPARRDSLLRLLDDPSPAVRQALLAYFSELGEPAHVFLREMANAHNRLLSRHAQWFLNQLHSANPVAEFSAFIRSLNYELESGALLLARTVNPYLNVGACRATLDQIAARCRELVTEPTDAREKCRVLNRVLFHEWGFHGNREHYTDPLNSLIDRVLERRRGIPVSLSLLYLFVAERIGLELEPVGVPGHFLVGCFQDDTVFFIDAFERGLFRDAPDVLELMHANHLEPQLSDLAPTPVREVLCRCCRNLVNHYHKAGDAARARLFAGFVEEFESAYERHST
ncbi:MAG: transglutaminase family protein [Opitutaceae bacterium]|nr:transglutaminase family protein [Opitutaceae bacterium]